MRIRYVSLLTAALMMLVGYRHFHHKPLIQTIYAQALPINVHAEMIPNPASDQVTNYTFQLDTGVSVSVGASVDSTCSCIKSTQFQVSDNASHTIHAKAVNVWGVSPDTALVFQVVIPKAPTGTVKPN